MHGLIYVAGCLPDSKPDLVMIGPGGRRTCPAQAVFRSSALSYQPLTNLTIPEHLFSGNSRLIIFHFLPSTTPILNKSHTFS